MALGLDYSSYSSSDDAEPRRKRAKVLSPPPAEGTSAGRPARRLPSLPASFASASAAHDNPELHQGKRRARPFVDGDYYAHVYAELEVSPSLGRAIDALVADAASGVDGAVHSLLHEPAPASEDAPRTSWRPLHVSLSHPLPLRRDMVRGFPSAVGAALRPAAQGGFKLSLAGAPVVYYNAPRGTTAADAMRLAGRGTPSPGARAFLGIRVGAGATDLSALNAALEPVLSRHHLPLYHTQPEFHTSVAWALCPELADSDDARDAARGVASSPTPFPAALVDRLASHTDALVAAQPRGGWHVSALSVKIAKNVVRIEL